MVRNIIIGVCLALSVTVIFIAFLQRRYIERSLFREASERAYEQVLRATPNHLDAKVIAEPSTAASLKALKGFIRDLRGAPISRLTVWSKDRVIVFSDLNSIIGYRPARTPELDRLFRDGKPFFVQKNQDDGDPPQSAIGEFLDLYFPLTVSGVVIGAVQLHASVVNILAPVRYLYMYNTALLGASVIAVLIICLVAKHLRDDRDRLHTMSIKNEKLYQETRNQARELARSNTELEQFAYVASHDLQEPLRMITSYTTLLAKRYKGKLDNDADEFIGFAVDGAKRMQVLIQDLLTYSRVTTKGKEFTATDCEPILLASLQGLAVAISESSAQISHDPLPTVMGDAGQLGQLFQNLIGNAIKYRNGNTPEVHVSCARQASDWLFGVKDNGIGIDSQYAEKIFVIFQRLHTRQEYDGTGIGLAVCKKIVDRHGGKIWFESEPGKGSTFFFTLPLKTESEDATHVTSASMPI